MMGRPVRSLGDFVVLLLLSAFLLLIGAPAALLVLGRAIGRATDFERRRRVLAMPALETGEAWYFRKMRPAFRWVEDDGKQMSGSQAD